MLALNEYAARSMLARMLSNRSAEPKPPIPEFASVFAGLFRDIRLKCRVECRSLFEIEQAFICGKLEPIPFAFKCRDDLGAHFRNVFGTLIASPLYAVHSGWAWQCARKASEAWMSGVIRRFGALGALLAENFAACLRHELMFLACGNEFGMELVRRWRNVFLAGNFPGGVFRYGTFTVFVA
jgi:hypothetical protein